MSANGNTDHTEDNKTASNKPGNLNAPKAVASSSTDQASGSSTQSTNALAKQAKDAVSHIADQAKEKIGNQLSEQTKGAVNEIGNVAKALKQTSTNLGDNVASPLVGRAADEIQKASDFLQNATVDEIVGSVEGFAKREPLLFLGGAFLVGMLGARFLKSSSHNQVTSSMKTSEQSRNRVGQQSRPQARPPAGLSHLASGSVGSSGRS